MTTIILVAGHGRMQDASIAGQRKLSCYQVCADTHKLFSATPEKQEARQKPGQQ